MMCPECDTRLVEEYEEDVCGCTGNDMLVTIPTHCPACGWRAE